MSNFAGVRSGALLWGLILVEEIVVAVLGLILLVAPGASLFFLVLLLGIYLLVAGIFRIIGIFQIRPSGAGSWPPESFAS